MSINKKIENFIEEGYVLLDLYSQDYIKEFKEVILNELKKITNNTQITLESFHEFIKDDEEKIRIQYELNKKVWDNEFHIKIFEDNIKIYYDLIGKDLDIQVKPYLRIARPNYSQDNIGFHRDSFYGNSAYEISNFIPLVDLDKDSALMIEPKSHKRGTIPYKNIDSKDVQKGSIKNQLGFLYSPKIIDESFELNVEPIPMKFGQLLIFGLGTIHGQEINSSNTTRWSIDIRVKNKFAPTNTKEEYYKELSLSPISQSAKIYYEKNPNEL